MTKNKSALLSIWCLVFALLALLCPYSLRAQVDTAKAKQLKEVQIKAKKLNQLLSSATPMQMLSGDELKGINSLSVADAIRYFSGVQLKDYGGIGGLKTINVRSMGTNHTAVFYDGIQLGNAQNGQVDLGKFSLDNIEEIALYSGQKTDLLMPAKAFASASALYLKTPTPKFEQDDKRNFRLSLKGGSFGLIDPSVNYNQKLKDHLAFNVSAELVNADGKYEYRYTNSVYDTTVVRTNAAISSQRVEGGLYGTTADSSKWQVKIYNYNSERGVPGAIVANVFDFSQRQWDDNFFVQSSYESKIDEKYQVLINAKYAYDFTRYLDPERLSLAGPLDNRYTQQEAYLSIANELQLASFWNVGLSADYSYQKLDANLIQFAFPTRQTGLISLATKFDWERFNFQANVLATFVGDKVESNIPAGDKTEVTPTVLASWQPFNIQGLRLRAFYKSIFRMPTFNDLYYTFIGNTNLRPEYTDQYDFGFTYTKSFKEKKLANFSIKTDIYYNKVKDKIVAIPTVNLFRWTMVNLDEVEIKGVETNLQSNWLFGKLAIKAKLNYTYEQALDMTKTGFTYRNQIPYIPVNSGAVTIGAEWNNFGLNYSYIYTGERYSQKANIPENYIKPWYTHDLALQKSFSYAKGNYRIATEINNLFNQYYDVVLNYPMPGRNYRLTLIANF